MNLEHLRNFITLVEFMNFTKAAEYLHLAQSTLSKQMSALEGEFNTTLMYRSNRGIELTPHGAYLYEQGKLILTHMEDIRRYIGEENCDATGSMIFSTITIDYPIFFHAVNELRETRPRASIHLMHNLLSDVIKNVSLGKADFGVTSDYALNDSPPTARELERLFLKREQFFMMAPEEGMYANRKSLSIGALQTGTRLLMPSNLHSYLDRKYDSPAFLKSMTITPTGVDYHSWETMVMQVRSGFGLALVPRPLSHNGCVVLPVDDFELTYEILAIWKTPVANSLVSVFLDILKRTMSRASGG